VVGSPMVKVLKVDDVDDEVVGRKVLKVVPPLVVDVVHCEVNESVDHMKSEMKCVPQLQNSLQLELAFHFGNCTQNRLNRQGKN
jgi:hypothetical protein